MPRILTIALAAIIFTAPSLALAQAAQVWIPKTKYLQVFDSTFGIRVPGLATSTTGCLSVNSIGWISASGSACGSGSGGGTSGVATTSFNTTDFDASASTISIDYTNGQKATGAQPGFLTAADWTTFNNKQSALSFPLSILLGGTGTATPAILGDVLAWNGTNWQGRATSTLGISSGGATPGGADTQIQFNNAGAFAGDYRFIWDAPTALLTLTNDTDGTATTTFSAFGIDQLTADTGFHINGYDGQTTEDGGGLEFIGGTGGASSGKGGDIFVTAGSAQGGDSDGGDIAMTAGAAAGAGSDDGGGSVSLEAGIGGNTSDGGNANITAGAGGSTSGEGGSISITAGSAQGGDSEGGNINFISGSGDGSGDSGNITFSSLGRIIFENSTPERAVEFTQEGTGNRVILDVSDIANDRTFAFPDASGTFCLVGVACDGTGLAWPFTRLLTFATSTVSTSTSIHTAGVFFASSTIAASQFPYASSTMLSAANASTTALTISNTTAALGLFGATGILGEYAGSSNPCTNQVPTTISAVGALGGCTSINNSWWSGADLSVANGGTGVSTFGGSGTVLFTTAADTLSSSANLTFVANKLNMLSASSTNLGVSGSFFIPTATTPVLTASGQMAIQTTAASTSIAARAGGSFNVFASTTVSWIYPTSTPTTATTTEFIQFANRGQAFMNFACRSVGGNAQVRIGTGTASSTYAVAVTGAPTPINFTPITFNAWSIMYVEIGGFSTNAVTRVNCGFTKSDIY